MIPEKVLTLMNEQIKNELESAYIYHSMAAYFHSISLDGMAHWMRCQIHEETIHAMKFFDHIIDRGGKVTLLDLKQLKTTWSAPIEAWKDACEHEEFITGKINTLMKAAREENDFAAEPLLSWFVDEQIEEEASTSKIYEQLKLMGDSNQGLIMLDKELGARAYPPGSPYDPLAYKAAD
jgi:ferritin